MAVPLAKVNPRQGKYSKLLPALALYLTYFLLLSTAKSLIEEGTLPILSIWLVQIIFFITGIILHMQSLGKSIKFLYLKASL
jgi:lipopolysaccharide export system permease protein